MTTLSDFQQPNPAPVQPPQRFEPLQNGVSFEAARDYCLQNLKTHPLERLWFWQPEPGSGTCRISREVLS